MKIADIKFTRGVESLGREDVRLPLVKAARDVALAGAIGSAAASVGDIAHTQLEQLAESRQLLQKELDDQAKRIKDRQILMDSENAQTNYSQGNSALIEKHSSIREYAPEDVNMEGDKPIPAYEVQPKIFREERIRMMEEQAASIRDPDTAAQFRGNTRRYIEQQYARDVAAAAGIQYKVHRENQADNIEMLAGQGKYDAAREMVKGFEGTEEEKTALKFGVDKKEEEDEMELAVGQKDVINMERLAIEMKQDPEKYEGTLTQAERTSWAGKLDRAIYQSKEQGRSDLVEYKKSLNKMGQEMVSALNNAYDIPTERVNAVIAKVKEFYPLLAADIVRASKNQDISARLAWVSPAARKSFVESTRDMVDTELQATDHKQVSAAVAQMDKEQADDSATYGLKRGLTDQVNLDLNNLPESLIALNKNDNILRANIGPTTGIFTKPQAQEFAKAISVMTPDQLLVVYASVEGALGSEANKVYEQLKSEGLTGSLAIAGQVYTAGDALAAQQIIEGRRHRQNYPKMFTLIEKDIDHAIDLALGSMYKDKQGQHELMREAIKDAYATRLGDDVRPETPDDGILEWAVQEVTGGRITANHMSIVSPERGMPQGAWDDYVDDIKISTLSRMGRPIGMTLGQLRDDIHDEKIQFRSAGVNEYYLFHEPSNEFVRDELTGGVFIFKYMSEIEADAVDPIPAKRKADAIAEIVKEREGFQESKKQAMKDIKALLKKAGKTSGEIGDFLQTPLGELLDKEEDSEGIRVRPGNKIPDVIVPKVKSRLMERAGKIGDWLNKPIADFF